MKATTTFQNDKGKREKALVAFAEAVSKLPFNEIAAREALLKVEMVGGKELATEAIIVAASFEAQTKIVDATVRKNPSMSLLKLALAVIYFGKSLLLLLGLTGALLAIVTVFFQT